MSLAILFLGTFKQLGLADADELSKAPLSSVAARVRGSLKSRAKILKTVHRCSHSQALEYLAQGLGFSNWFDCNRELSLMEAAHPCLPSPGAATKLFTVMVDWPGPSDTDGAVSKELMLQGRLATHVVIAHAHGHQLSKAMGLTLADALDLSARLHGATDWTEYVYQVPYWADMAAR